MTSILAKNSGVGGIAVLTVSSESSTFAPDALASVYLCDATSGDITVNLPAASTCTNRTYWIKKIDSSANSVIIDGNGSETIDGETTQEIADQYVSITIISDGFNWLVI